MIIKQEKNGKPYLFGQNENTAVHFNLSNSNNIAAYAFSKMKDIGIDIEKIRPIPDMMDIAANNFTEKENVLIAQCDTDSRSDMFYRIWTRKEAVLKAQGVGLLVPLDSVDVSMSIDQKGPTQVNISGENQTAEIWVNEIDCASGYKAALAAHKAFQNITVTNCQTA